MHWVLDQKLRADPGYEELLEVVERASLPHSFHKVIPFVGDLEPDITPVGPAIVFGAYSMRNTARTKKWVPGSFDLGDLTYADHVAKWSTHMLNADGVTCRFSDVPRHVGDKPFFIRPTVDSKVFAGTVMTRQEFEPWLMRVAPLGADDGLGLRASTEVLVAKPKMLLREYRLWMVDGDVATASLYRLAGVTALWRDVERDVLDFGRSRACEWSPARAFVLDVALTEDGFRIIETNTLNAASLYAADAARLVGALEAMPFE